MLKMKKAQVEGQTKEEDFQKNSENSVLSGKDAAQELNIEDKIELQRREAYIEPKTRDFLRELLQDPEKRELIPLYTPGIGYVYQLTEKGVAQKAPIELSKVLLENLAILDILQKNFFDSVSSCPHCDSIIVTMHHKCPKCKSHNVEKTNLTEHIRCGHIDQRSMYINDHCPKCGELLIEGQYRNMGRWYVCKQCNERFENPEFDMICRTCKKTFSIKEANVQEISKFTLNLKRVKEIRQNVASLENIRKVLTDLGFQVQIPGLAIGEKSEMQHHFSLIAKKIVNGKDVIIALDHAVSESEVTTSPIILYIYKTSEIKVDIPIFVAMPQLNESAKKVALGHNIMVIDSSTEEKEIMEKIELAVNKRGNQTTEINESKVTQPQPKADSISIFSRLLGKKVVM